MGHNQNCCLINFLFHVGSFNSFLCVIMLFETNKSTSRFIWVQGNGIEITISRKNSSQLLLSKAFNWKISDIQIGILVTLIFSIIFLGVNHHFNLFVLKLCIVKFLDCLLCRFYSFELNISKTSAFTISINFNFARFNISEFSEKSSQFFLISFLWKVSNYNVSFAIKATCVILLLIKND